VPHAALPQDRRCVVDVGLVVGKAHHDDRLADAQRQLVHRRARSLEEGGLEQQILGRISRNGELGEDDHVRGQGLGARERRADPLEIPADVADHDVDLGEGQAEGTHRR
jgi:hypothetical protein